MACSALPLETAEKDLTHCYYLAVHCRKDGEIRVATEGAIWRMLPVSRLPALCHSSLLGEGGTLRSSRFERPRKRKRQSLLIDTSLDSIPKCKSYLFNRPFDLDEILAAPGDNRLWLHNQQGRGPARAAKAIPTECDRNPAGKPALPAQPLPVPRADDAVRGFSACKAARDRKQP